MLAVGITLAAAGACFGRAVVFLFLAFLVLQVASEGRKAEGSLCLLCTRPWEAANTWHMSTGNNSYMRDGCLPWVAFQEQGDFERKKCCCAQLPSCTCCYQKLPPWIPFLQSQILLQSITRCASCWLFYRRLVWGWHGMAPKQQILPAPFLWLVWFNSTKVEFRLIPLVWDMTPPSPITG